jgi:hypothetical protein
MGAGLALFLLSHTGAFYTLTHGSWHLASAALAYRYLEEHDHHIMGMPLSTPRIDALQCEQLAVAAWAHLQNFIAVQTATARAFAEVAATATSALRSLTIPIRENSR